jgi:ankyrin repeat protein
MAKSNRTAKVDIIAAAMMSEVETLKRGLAQGADIDRRDCDGMTALMCAAEAASVECLAVLIQTGADVDGVDREGSTALILAAQSRSEACIGLLVEAGADLEPKDKHGRDVVYWAARRALPDAARMLEAIQESRAQRQQLATEVHPASGPGRPGAGRV